MMNYIKSELYRVTHTRGIYGFSIVLAGVCFLFNALLGWLGKLDGPDFPYNTTSFSYSNLVANPMIFCFMGAVVAALLYEGNRKTGNLKNTIAFGISRMKIFAGECITALITAVGSMLFILTVYIFSAMLFTEHTGPVQLMDLLTEIPAVFFLAVASLISAVICLEVFQKEAVGGILWCMIWFVIPKIFFYLGLRFEFFYNIAMWMPDNFMGSRGMIVNMSRSMTAWETPGGMAKCMIAGVIGIAVFVFVGAVTLRKREV